MENLNISDILKIIRKRWSLIIILMCSAGLVTGFVSFYILTPVYEATATLLVQPVNLENKINYDNLITNEKLVATYSEIIRSKKIAGNVINSLQLNISENDLLKKVRAEGIKDSLITAVTVRDVDPKRAVAIANGFAQAFEQNLPAIMHIENVTILDEAKEESESKPISPRPFFNILVMLVLALNTGFVSALFLEFLNKKIETEEMAEKILGLPVIVSIPKYPNGGIINIKSSHSIPKKEEKLFCLEEPKSYMAEAFRILRTNISYMENAGEIRTLVITSSLAGEGKTFITTNLATAMAQQEKKVLLMDCDLRKPRIHEVFNRSNYLGLSKLLVGEVTLDKVIVRTKQNNLDIITSGPIPPNPSELLSTVQMSEVLSNLKKSYDIILIDSSPILPF